MVLWGVLRALGLCLLGAGLGWAQSLPTAATIESIPLELTMPERYRVTAVLEPVRKVGLVAPADGIVRGLEVPLGTVVRANAEVAQLDRAEALARFKMAQAEKEQTAKVQSILPLPESYASLRELAAPFASAWVVVANAKGELAAGLRVRSANLPITPIATVPKESLKAVEGPAGSSASMVQVLRNEYVTNVPVEVLGKIGPERLQVSGALRSTDALIVSSSVPLLPGTLVRFAQAPGQVVEGTTPNPARQGVGAGITPPGAAAREPAAVPSGSSRSRPATPASGRPTPAAAPAPGQGSQPF